jgi:hypothetical protein
VDDVEAAMADGSLQSEPVVLFPVVACNSTTTPGDSSCREWEFTPGVAYPVVKLQGFYVKDAWFGAQAKKQANCDFTTPSSDVFCVHLQTTGTDDPPDTGGSVKVWLVD